MNQGTQELKYYYAKDGRQCGPVSFEELRLLAIRDELTRRDRIWRKGMQAWETASSIPGLFENLPPDLEPELHSERKNEVNSAVGAVVNKQTKLAQKQQEIPWWLSLIGFAVLVYGVLKHHNLL